MADKMIPVFAPDGSLGDIPESRVTEALRAGGKMAVQMRDPRGETGYIPSDRVEDAKRAGGKLVNASESARANFYLKKVSDASRGLVVGAGKGALQNVATISRGLNKIPYVGETLAPSSGVQRFNEITTPQGTAQTVGAGLEQAAELMLPGGALRKGATTLATKLPMLGRATAPLARMGAEAISTGANAAMHGQNPVTGAAAGAAGGAIGEAAASAAPKFADIALGVRRTDRMRGKVPGKAVLAETKGLNPDVVAEQAADQLAQLTKELETRAGQSQIPARLNNAVQLVEEELKKAYKANSKSLVKKLNAVKEQLTVDITTGQPFPPTVPAERVLHMKRGVDDLVSTWNAEEQKNIQGVVKRVYHVLDEEVDRTVPGAKELNDRMASLIPVQKRATEKAAGADTGQRVLQRVGAHTGALIPAAAAGGLGYREGGAEGAVVGVAAGLALPELLVSPRVQMGIARALASPKLGKTVIPVAKGVGLQATRTNEGGLYLEVVEQGK